MPEPLVTQRDYLEQIWRDEIVHTLHRNVWTQEQTRGSRHVAEFIWVRRGHRVEVVARARPQSPGRPQPART
jgi:hypothetical protein